MGIGPSNKLLLENEELKHRKVRVFTEMSLEEERKYKLKVYGDSNNEIISKVFQ